MMSEIGIESIKNHLKCIGRVLLVQFLAIALSWAAYPLIFLLLRSTIDGPLTVFSIFATIVFGAMLVAQGNEYGLQDKKPYKWARYKGKGFVIGALVGILIFLLELFMIFLADRLFSVNHPQFSIVNINSYMRMFLYMPFFWFFELLNNTGNIIPRVTPLTSLIVIGFDSVFTGIGYLLGDAGITIDFHIGKKRK